MFKQEIINQIENAKNDSCIKKKFIEIENFVKAKSNQPLMDFTNIKTNNLNFSNLVYQVVGVYCIVNLREQMIYIGQSQNLGERFDSHRLNLFSGVYEVQQLQNHFKNELYIKDFKTIHENLFSTTFFNTPLKYQLSDFDKTELDSLLKQVEREIICFFVNLNCKVYNDKLTYM